MFMKGKTNMCFTGTMTKLRDGIISLKETKFGNQ